MNYFIYTSQGPSRGTVKQIPNTKLIHVRFNDEPEGKCDDTRSVSKDTGDKRTLKGKQGNAASEDVMLEKAECLVHFSYEKSNYQVMLVDVQGVGYGLFDPEIASAELLDSQNEVLYTTGNLSVTYVIFTAVV